MKNKHKLTVALAADLLMLAVSVYGQSKILHRARCGREHDQNPSGDGSGYLEYLDSQLKRI